MESSAHKISIFISVWRLAIIRKFLSFCLCERGCVPYFLHSSWKQAYYLVLTLHVLFDKFSLLFGQIIHLVIKERISLPSIIQILVYFMALFTASLFKASRTDLCSSWLSLFKRMKLIATPFSVPRAFSFSTTF